VGVRSETRGLYLYGLPVVGKSTLIERLFRLVPRELVYVPTPGKYFGTDLDAKFCMGIIFEEFDIHVFRSSAPQLKRLLEGRDFGVEVKYGMPEVMRYDGAVIFVTILLLKFQVFVGE
jgi:GTPase SAR1 family protein